MARLVGTSGNDNFQGTEENDDLFGGSIGDINEERTGDDLLNGLGGDDTLRGGDGDDGLLGGDGSDNLFGEIGDDTLDGGLGDDTLNGADGDNQAQVSDEVLVASLNPFTNDSANASANIVLRTVANGIEFTVELLDTTADINGVFFNLTNTELLESLTVTGENVTDSQFGEIGSVNGIGGVNIAPSAFDAGIAIGTPSIGGEDDIRSTTFTLQAPEGSSLSLDDFVDERFGLRLTSVGAGRQGSSKLSGIAQAVENFGIEDEDVILGQSGNDIINGEEGNDLLDGGAGDDEIDGGSGVDRAGYLGTFGSLEQRGNNFFIIDNEGQEAYQITLNSPANLGITVTDLLTDGDNVDSGVDTLTNVEFLDFGGLTGVLTGTVDVAGLFDDQELNETPEVNLNRLLTINENQTNRILNTFLEVTDDNAANEITYTLASVPRQGTLFLDTNAEGSSGGRFNVVFNEGDTILAAEDTFTQGQIDNGLLGYQAPDVNPDVNDESSGFSFRFTASDPQDEATTGRFNIEVNPLNAPTVEDAEFLVSEFAVNGLLIGTLEFEDPDSDQLSFEITDASRAFVTRSPSSSPVPEDIDTDNDGQLPFTINEQGQITVNDAGDLEPLELFAASFSDFNVFIREFPSFDLTVEVSDGTNTVEAQVDVDILGAPIAFGFGDPRVTTFDRNTFDFQVVGEFTLVESTDENNPLTVQARTEAAPLPDGGESDSLSNYTAVAVEFDGEEIAIYSGEENPVVVNNGDPITLEVGEILPVGDSGIEITRPEIQGSDDDQEGGSDFYQINLNDQERLIVQVFDNRLDPQIQLSDEREGNVTGVFGNNDGNPNNDLVLEDGTNLDDIEDINEKLDRINNDFAARWRITDPTNSRLVREEENENLEEINNLEFPRVAITIDNFQEELGLTDEEVSDIEEQVREAGVPEGPLFDAAVIDLAATNDDSFVGSAQNVGEGNVAPTVENADFTIGEDLPNERVVGSVNISDADDNLENLTVTITEGNPDTNDDGEAAFAIDGVTGNLTINDSDELAARGSTFTLTVVAEDPLGTTDTATVTVTEQNAPPVFGEFQTDFSINRQAVESGDSIVTLAVTDGNDDPLRFSIQGNQDRDDDGVRPFRVNEENQLIINDEGDLTSDFDLLTVTVNDGQGGSDTVNLSIDVNLAPIFDESQFRLEPIELSGEGQQAATGDIVGQVAASDPEGDQVFLEIVGGNDRNNDGVRAFTINQQGQIRINSLTEIDNTAEAGNNYNLRVSASDAGEASTFADVIIPLNIAENQAPVLPTQAFTIAEDETAGTEVGTVFADDPDGDEITFSLTDSLTDATGNFTIDPDSGLITVADGVTEDTFDFETRSGFGLDVTATDSEGNVTGPNRINVNLSDVNDESPVITPPDEPFTVAENAEAGAILGTIEANDDDGLEGEPDELTFSITEGNSDVDDDGNPAFAINNNNGQLEVNDPDDLDFENQSQRSFELTVEVSDGVNDPDSTPVTINVTNQNESPVITVPDINTVDVENSTEGDPIVTIEADDPEDNDFTFSIIAGNPNTDGDDTPPALAIDETTGAITIADLNDFTGTLRPTILVEDETGARTSQQITIPVDTAENDPPVFEEDAFNFEVPENSAADTSVGTVVATDADPDSNLTFALEENDNFAINSDGEITVAEEATLDFEGTNTFNLTVTVTDEIIDTPVEAPVTINLTNADEPPVFETEQALSSIRANAAVGTVVDTVDANDPEGDPITFAITEGNPNGDGDETSAVAINPNTGQVTVADTGDLIAGEDITLTVELSQEGEVQGTITATIDEIGEPDNEPPNITTAAEQTIAENQTDVVAVEADDPNGDALTFSLSGGDDQGFFTIDGDGNLSFSEAPNFENPADTDGNNVYQVQVEVDDGNGGTDTQDFSITVNDVNEAPVVEDQSFTIDENSDVGTEIGTVEASDPEADELTFSFDQDNLPTDVDGDGELPFSIADDGLITVNDSGDLDFETQDSFSFGVVATESDGDQFGTGTVTVNLDDVEEPTFDLDVDDNGAANGSVDGLNILRVLFNLGPETMDVSQAGDLTQQEVFNNIQEGNQEENPILDVDNNGAANGSVDGLNILRVLFNLGPETMDVSQAGDLTQQDVFNNIEALETTV
ncbi:UNVERIFIED_CONTAM: hypothetical protein BEN50_09530 [Euhalothece sp. KZN 001]